MTAIMSQQWDWETAERLDEEGEGITGAYPPDDAEIAVSHTWLVPGAWVDSASCAQIDPRLNLWYPEEDGATIERGIPGGKGDDHRDAKQYRRHPVHRVARMICRECPVQAECLDYAIAVDDQHGIWGGMNYAERQAEKIRRGLAKAELVA